MQKVYIAAHNIISSLGKTSAMNFSRVEKGETGVQLHIDPQIDDQPFWASRIDEELFSGLIKNNPPSFSRFEHMLAASVADALSLSTVDPESPDTVFIVSTTKGNIALLGEEENTADLLLHTSAQKIAAHFKNPNTPVVVSNACISGVQAILYAKRLIEAGRYATAIVSGADILSRFIFSGFKSFQALSARQCKPFSEDRDGINLGEAAATVILTAAPSVTEVLGGAVSNDSNHISGPSRTGEELSQAINKALHNSQINAGELDFISAHGTATPYNDEMEARAFALSGLINAPINSLKGYFGHTLGAAGLVESVISIQSLLAGVVIPTAGYTTYGVSRKINICNHNLYKDMQYCLKTASGFGGCNAALVFGKSPTF